MTGVRALFDAVLDKDKVDAAMQTHGKRNLEEESSSVSTTNKRQRVAHDGRAKAVQHRISVEQQPVSLADEKKVISQPPTMSYNMQLQLQGQLPSFQPSFDFTLPPLFGLSQSPLFFQMPMMGQLPMLQQFPMAPFPGLPQIPLVQAGAGSGLTLFQAVPSDVVDAAPVAPAVSVVSVVTEPDAPDAVPSVSVTMSS